MAGSSLTSTLKVQLIDDVSKPARTVAQALKDAEKAARDVAKGMEGAGATGRLQKDLAKLSLSKKDIEQVGQAWRDYAKSAGLAANSADWTKAQAQQVRAWEAQTLASLRAVKREQAAFAKSSAVAARQAARPNEYIDHAAKGIAGAIAAHKFAELGKQAYEAGAERSHVRVGAMNAGIGPDELKRIEAASISTAKTAPNLSVSEIMELHKEGRSAVQHPDEMFHLLPDLAKAASVLKGMGAENANIADLVKAGESLGLMNDPKRFHDFLSGQVKAMNVMGRTITTEQIYEAAKYAKSAGATLSDRFLNTVMPSTIQELHGSSAGDALSMLTQALRGGLKAKHLAVERMNDLGLLADPSQIRRTKKTQQIMGYTGKVVRDDLLASDPDRWFQKVFKPAAIAKGFTSLSDQIKLLSEILPRTAANLGRVYLQQEESLAQHARNYDAAPDLDKAVENQKGDAKASVGALSKALDDLEAEMTGPIIPSIAGGVVGLIQTLRELADAAHNSPNMSATVSEITALGAAFIALNAAPFAASMVGLEGLATGLTVFAAALNPVVAILAVAALALNATNAMEDARKSGKDPDKTYTSDALLGLSNWLRGLGGGAPVHPDDHFDFDAYQWRNFKNWRDREMSKPKVWSPGDDEAPMPPRRPFSADETRARLAREKQSGEQPAAPGAVAVDHSALDAVPAKAGEAKQSLDALAQPTVVAVDHSALDGVAPKAGEAKQSLDALAQPTVVAVDHSALDGVAPKAGEAKQSLETLAAPVAIAIDSSSVVALIGQLQRASSLLASLNAGVAHAAHGLTPIGKKPGGHFTLDGIGG